jgi:hypothetical protein
MKTHLNEFPLSDMFLSLMSKRHILPHEMISQILEEMWGVGNNKQFFTSNFHERSLWSHLQEV